ncbi:MAG TPA: amidohydrolase family protein [Myxococcaceae bacterium]|nr:amidohydrolase family protein [Myxococcaceae bacterium]
MVRRLAPLLLAAVLPSTALAQAADRALLTELAKVKAVDAHSHLLINRVEPAGKALAQQRSATDLPLRLRGLGPEWARTWKLLYKVNVPDPSDKRFAEPEKRFADLQQARELLVEDLDGEFSARMLDQANVEMAIVSGEPLTGKGLERFRFVPRADVFLRPFAQDSAEALKPFFIAARIYTLPKGLDEYLRKVVTAALERWVSEGAVGIDLGISAWRSLDFDEVNAEAARSAYGRLVIGGEFGASPADLKAFQDYTFRYLAREAGRVGLVVHVKTGMSRDATGIVGNGNPILLGSAMADPTLQKTKWLLVHGGFPFDKETGPLLLRPNVYADVSVQDLVRSPTELGESLRRWFELAPERVCFATDAASDPSAPQLRWPELTYLGAETTRAALAIALSRMISDGMVTRTQALEIGKGVLRENALALHGLGPQQSRPTLGSAEPAAR